MRRLLCLVIVACGSPNPPPTPVGPPAAIEAQRASPDDVIVAQVNGRPVWGSCVAIQAKRTGATRDAALRQCVDFELLAQSAEKRGFATNPDVVFVMAGARDLFQKGESRSLHLGVRPEVYRRGEVEPEHLARPGGQRRPAAMRSSARQCARSR
jgi:hypothetical protein